jgi:hypothetical protein
MEGRVFGRHFASPPGTRLLRSGTLVDGDTIQRTTTAQVARDSRGRTYTQQTMTSGPWAADSSPKTVIFLFDPVAGYSYVLHPDKKVAMRRPIGTPRKTRQARTGVLAHLSRNLLGFSGIETILLTTTRGDLLFPRPIELHRTRLIRPTHIK